MPCRSNRRRLWTVRMLLEQRMHDVPSWFVTLTYGEKHAPKDGCVNPRDLQLWLKRLRLAVAPARVRFYGVGEYGDLSMRPHYHVVVYGAPVLDHDHRKAMEHWAAESRVDGSGRGDCGCAFCAAWGLGVVYIGEVTPESCAYVAGYTTKRATVLGDPRLGGRHPEFARMSLRPGIGADAMQVLSKALTTRDGGREVARTGDVSSVVRFSGKLWPLGRYLRRKLREEVGMDPGAPAESLARIGRDMQACLREPGARVAREEKRQAVARNAEARNRITNSKKGQGI